MKPPGHERIRAVLRRLACLALLAALHGCAVGGVLHTVRPGENLYRIGKAYGVSYRELASVNHISAPYRLEVGERLYIPGAQYGLPVTTITPRSVNAAPPTEVAFRRDGRVGSTGFSWPLAGRLSSSFGRRPRGHHDGIDIAAPHGSAVHAAREGRVIFSDRLRGYGNVVIVEHGDKFTTVYAHNDTNVVGKGSYVRRGDRIATVGDTGRASGPHLHFEVRKDNVARNPLYYLPSGAPTSVAAVR